MQPLAPPPTLVLQPARLRPWLAAAWGLLLGLTLLAYLNGSGEPRPLLMNWFDLSGERSLPQSYQAVLWLGLGGLALLAARRRASGRSLNLAASLCVAVALEHFIALHSPLERALAPALGAFTRLVLAVPTAVVLALLAARFVPALPAAMRTVVVSTGLLWGASALGLYALSAFPRASGAHPLLPAALDIASQFLSLAAVSFALVRLLELAAERAALFQFNLAGAAPRAVLRFLASVALVLVVVSTLAGLSLVMKGPVPYDWLQRLSLDEESSLPTAFSGAVLLAAALLVGTIAALKRQARDFWRNLWRLLAVVFAYLAADELVSLHEHLTDFVPAVVERSGLFHFAWVLPVLPVVLVFALLYLRFLWRLPPRTRALFVLAGLLYTGGALGFEMLGGLVLERFTLNSLPYLATSTLEETLEMFGALVFVYALLDYLAAQWGCVRVALAGPHTLAAHAAVLRLDDAPTGQGDR